MIVYGAGVAFFLCSTLSNVLRIGGLSKGGDGDVFISFFAGYDRERCVAVGQTDSQQRGWPYFLSRDSLGGTRMMLSLVTRPELWYPPLP